MPATLRVVDRLPTGRTLEDFRGTFQKLIFPDSVIWFVKRSLVPTYPVAPFWPDPIGWSGLKCMAASIAKLESRPTTLSSRHSTVDCGRNACGIMEQTHH